MKKVPRNLKVLLSDCKDITPEEGDYKVCIMALHMVIILIMLVIRPVLESKLFVFMIYNKIVDISNWSTVKDIYLITWFVFIVILHIMVIINMVTNKSLKEKVEKE